MKLKFFPPRLRRLGLMEITANHPGFAGEVMVEDNSFLAGFDRDSGAPTRLEKFAHWTIEGPLSSLDSIAPRRLEQTTTLHKRDYNMP
jgi:hypothetical protein